MMSWNVKSGGFDAYDPCSVQPERERAIWNIIHGHHKNYDVAAASLIDAYRWDELYGGEQGIANYLGYTDARFTRLDDPRLMRNKGAGIGIAFATDEKIAASKVLDLVTRKGLGVVLDIGKHGLQIASVYLDDLDPDIRLKQVDALQAELEPGVPTVLTGDFNDLRATLRGAALRHRLGDVAVRIAARVLPRRSEFGQAVGGMNRRQVIPRVEEYGYRDADPAKRPTALGPLRIFGVDYAFHTSGVQIDNLTVLNNAQTRRASDHLPIVFDVHEAPAA
jgi:endonuclease/exonuclease/phosphatase family metal-dependent hydrolase